MPWTRTPPVVVPRVGADDISTRVYVSNDLDGKRWRIEVTIAHDGGTDVQDFPIDESTLTNAQRTALRQTIRALRDEALTRAGYVNTP